MWKSNRRHSEYFPGDDSGTVRVIFQSRSCVSIFNLDHFSTRRAKIKSSVWKATFESISQTSLPRDTSIWTFDGRRRNWGQNRNSVSSSETLRRDKRGGGGGGGRVPRSWVMTAALFRRRCVLKHLYTNNSKYVCMSMFNSPNQEQKYKTLKERVLEKQNFSNTGVI